MYRKLIFIIFLFSTIISFSQEEIDFDCPSVKFSSKKNSWKGNNQLLYNHLTNFPLLESGHIYYNIPLTIHIFLNPRENIEVLNRDIKRAINNLNYFYKINFTGIQFYVADIIYYKEPNHLKSGYTLESFFLGQKDFNKNSINIYFVNVLQLNLLVKKIRYRGMYSSITQSVLIVRHSSQTTLSHEIGHYLGLLHPHKNWKKGKSKQECVSRTKTKPHSKKLICETNGDYLHDTPAEPDLRYYSNKACEYTGFLTDDWGELYSPNVNNIMSYPYKSSCRTTFTTLQKAVMLYTISSLKQEKNWKTCSENNKFAFDENEPDDAMSMATELEFYQKNYYSINSYINYKNELKLNESDWCMINSSKRQKIKLIFQKAKNVFPKMIIFVFDSNFKCISTLKINTPQSVELEIEKGKYFLKIQNKTLQNTGLLDYYLSILD